MDGSADVLVSGRIAATRWCGNYSERMEAIVLVRRRIPCHLPYEVDAETEPARDRRPMSFTEVYLAHVGVDDFRRNSRGELGTRTATLHRDGVRKLREHWVYKT